MATTTGRGTADNKQTGGVASTWREVLIQIFQDPQIDAGKTQAPYPRGFDQEAEQRIINQTRALLKVMEDRGRAQGHAALALIEWFQEDKTSNGASWVLERYAHDTLHERCSRILTQIGQLLELTIPDAAQHADTATFTVDWNDLDGVGHWVYPQAGRSRGGRDQATPQNATPLRHLIHDAIVVAGEFGEDTADAEILTERTFDGFRRRTIDLPGYELRATPTGTNLVWQDRRVNLTIPNTIAGRTPEAALAGNEEFLPDNLETLVFDHSAELANLADQVLRATWVTDLQVQEDVRFINAATLDWLFTGVASALNEDGNDMAGTAAVVRRYLIELLANKLESVRHALVRQAQARRAVGGERLNSLTHLDQFIWSVREIVAESAAVSKAEAAAAVH
jgi:hypothetical protein